MRVLLLYTDADFYRNAGYDRAWRRALRARGVDVDVIPCAPAAWSRVGPAADRWDLAIAHVLVEEVVSGGRTLRAAALLERCGVAMLNDVACLVASADKAVTHAVWAAAGLPQPRTWTLEEVRSWPAAAGQALVLKPAWGDGARHIELVRSVDDAHRLVATWREDERAGGERRGPALLQEWVAEPTCLRLFATPQETSLAYEKSRRPEALITHGTTYTRAWEPCAELADLARAMVCSLGGGLLGVDVLRDEAGRHWALEANAPFGFDVTDVAQCDAVARLALTAVSRGRASAGPRGPVGRAKRLRRPSP